MEEVDRRRIHAILVNLRDRHPRVSGGTGTQAMMTGTYKVRRDPAREQRALVRDGQPLEERVEPDRVDERLGDRATHDAALARLVVEEVRVLELLLELVELARELVRDDRARLRALQARVLAPDAPELVRRVLGADPLDVAHVALVERGGLAVLEDHVLCVLFGGEAESGEDLERGAGDAALVRAGVFEEDDLALLEEQTGLLCDEEVRAPDDVLEMRLALGV